MNKKFLIFSGVGDNENHFFSWYENKSNIYDRAIFYYGDKKQRKEEVLKNDPEYFFELKGMIWSNFVKLYEKHFIDYEYVLIVDSDIVVPQKDIENTFFLFQKKQYYAGTWSRSGNDFGYFVPFFSMFKKTRAVSKSNFIEMLFMIIKKELIELTIEKWLTLNLDHSTGIDLVLSNVAYNNNMLPFHVINFYEIYNPFPEEKPMGREIERILDIPQSKRIEIIDNLLEKDEYFKIQNIINMDGENFYRS